jgi:hypothetical protein
MQELTKQGFLWNKQCQTLVNENKNYELTRDTAIFKGTEGF